MNEQKAPTVAEALGAEWVSYAKDKVIEAISIIKPLELDAKDKQELFVSDKRSDGYRISFNLGLDFEEALYNLNEVLNRLREVKK